MSYLEKLKKQMASGLEKPRSTKKGVDQAEKRRSNFASYLKKQKDLILSHQTPVELHGKKKGKRLRLDFWKKDGLHVFEPRYGSSRVYMSGDDYQLKAETPELLGEAVETLILATREGELDEALQKAAFKRRGATKLSPDTTPDDGSQNKPKSGGNIRVAK